MKTIGIIAEKAADSANITQHSASTLCAPLLTSIKVQNTFNSPREEILVEMIER